MQRERVRIEISVTNRVVGNNSVDKHANVRQMVNRKSGGRLVRKKRKDSKREI